MVIKSAASNYGEGSTIQVHDDGVATITSSIGFYIWSSSSSADGSFVDPSTLKQKIMAGYQGWFYTDSDGKKSGRLDFCQSVTPIVSTSYFLFVDSSVFDF